MDSWVRIRTALKFSLLVFFQDEISIEWYEHMRAFLLVSGAWPGSRALELYEFEDIGILITFLPFRIIRYTVNNENKIIQIA